MCEPASIECAYLNEILLGRGVQPNGLAQGHGTLIYNPLSA